MRGLPASLVLASLLAAGPVAAGEWVRLPGGEFQSVLRYEDTGGKVAVAPFELQRRPVTNAEYAAFLRGQPDWRRDRVPSLFADQGYLQRWAGPLEPGPEAQPAQPVVEVSWFAAQAYCEARGARLPTWDEWEYAAAADETRVDARADPAWRERILAWYSVPSGRALPEVGRSPANVHGVQDLHGLVWEWVDDYAAMLVSADNRDQGDPDLRKFCGAGALSMDDRENYAVMMRVAMLSALQARDTTRNLGFRCARDVAEGDRP
ncbi:MAG TPA: formylglycine-generating enzyme family protein [Arenimonas sp.]|nr:formylglycine-generating enzyme family protein [Arenimonas sp.]